MRLFDIKNNQFQELGTSFRTPTIGGKLIEISFESFSGHDFCKFSFQSGESILRLSVLVKSRWFCDIATSVEKDKDYLLQVWSNGSSFGILVYEKVKKHFFKEVDLKSQEGRDKYTNDCIEFLSSKFPVHTDW